MARRSPTREIPSTVQFTRDEFLAERWDYRPGEHVTILGPTGSGKTHLAYQLLDATASRDLPAVVMVMKPRDRTVSAWSKRIGLRRVHGWPPVPNPVMGGRRAGWTVWPAHTFDPDKDDPMLHGVFRAAILDSYKRGQRILFADEAAGLSVELDLDRELKTVWMRGRSMETGLWAASQRPVEIPLLAYSMAHHLFLAADPDYRTRQRYAEIGGIDPEIVHTLTRDLPEHHFLYIRRRGQRRAVILP
jgi:hypothetical protein